MSSKTAVLNYHGIQARAEEYGWSPEEHLYVLERSVFENQMDVLGESGFSVTAPEEIPQVEKTPENEEADSSAHRVLITFDDGHISHYEHAREVLKTRGFRAIFFVSAGFVGRPLFMNAAQLREMIQEGFEIASHGFDHQPLPGLPREKLIREVVESKKCLEDMTGSAVRSFSVPRGFYHSRVSSLAREAGYQLLFTSHFGLDDASDPFYIRRIAVTSRTSPETFRAWISGHLGAKRWTEEMKERARQWAGPRLYDKAAYLKARLIRGVRKKSA